MFVSMMRKTDTRQQILDTASVLFHSRSYADVGIAAVCDQAGVSKGSFFHFFHSKRDLALAVMDQFRGNRSHPPALTPIHPKPIP